MKKIVIFLISIFSLSFSFFNLVGCELKKETDEKTVNSEISKEINSEISSISNGPEENQIAVYRIGREEFELFLKSPSLDTIKSNDFEKYNYSKDNEWHNVVGSRFQIKKSLINLLCDSSKLEDLLLKNGINEKPTDAIIVDAPNVPNTIWVKTNKSSACFVIGELKNEDEYTYEFYSISDYAAKFCRTTATIIVNGKKLESDCETKLYHDYADVPFIAVLKALGADVGEISNGIVEFSIDNKTFSLNLNLPVELYQKGGGRGDLFDIVGGACFVYPQGEELMIDTDTLHVVFRYNMGLDVTIKCDRESKEISINTNE